MSRTIATYYSGSGQWMGDNPTLYRISARIPDGHLTCRSWRNAQGCHDLNCPFAHYITGLVSPVLPFTCWFWRHGSCAYHPDDCLYAHFRAENDQREPDSYAYFGMFRPVAEYFSHDLRLQA